MKAGVGSIRVALDNLGCKLNQAEVELLTKQFAEAGYKVVSTAEEADVYVLNTCTVTHIADSKSRHKLRQAHLRSPGALVVATGCYAERARQELAQIEGVALVLGNEQKTNLVQILQESGRLENLPLAGLFFDLSSGLRTRAFIKIQDGCHYFCTYCIVPLVRGSEKSVPAPSVLAEVKQRLSQGHKEVVLTGVKIGAYNDKGFNLEALLERILAETGVTRLRLSSLHPYEITQKLVGLWRDRRLCRHFHLSLQSGSEGVLGRMNRRYSIDEYWQAISLIREAVPEAAITTDVIVGFPGETTEEFEQSFSICRRLSFARIHVFPYSPRQGTLAAQMSPMVASKIKRERSHQMLALAEGSARHFRQQFLGSTMPVLWEKKAGNGLWSGLTDNYIKVYTNNKSDLTNKLLLVRLVAVMRDGILGEIVK
ncbi:tRNA (N(6)-L-threonylcarbamoyladenosine(37)-C(2))-methylthiotransferase MtaB [Chloroflexota bacterium]